MTKTDGNVSYPTGLRIREKFKLLNPTLESHALWRNVGVPQNNYLEGTNLVRHALWRILECT
jgi:hypothetical protein